MKTALLTLTVLILAGCSSWHGPAEITLKDGVILYCPKGLTFHESGVTCEGKGIEIRWYQVAGYRTK